MRCPSQKTVTVMPAGALPLTETRLEPVIPSASLRPVSGLIPVTIGIALAKAWSKFDAAGNLYKPEELRAPLFLMMDRLTWWARVLKQARKSAPYNEVAA